MCDVTSGHKSGFILSPLIIYVKESFWLISETCEKLLKGYHIE